MYDPFHFSILRRSFEKCFSAASLNLLQFLGPMRTGSVTLFMVWTDRKTHDVGTSAYLIRTLMANSLIMSQINSETVGLLLNFMKRYCWLCEDFMESEEVLKEHLSVCPC